MCSGHLIAEQFLTLPSRKEIPDYYVKTKLPLAIDDIERKITSGQYATITEIESDLKRMVQNAKDYNTGGSPIFEDAEKIRKLVFNFMKVNNPAYNEIPGYSAVATPIPGEPQVNGGATPAATNGRTSETPARSRKATAPPPSEPPERRVSIAPVATPAAKEVAVVEDEDENESGVDFTGKTFQQAQELIINELLAYTDDEYVVDFDPVV